MDCRHAQMMECPTCGRAWCVREIVGKAQVWHSKCDRILVLVLNPPADGACTRGEVVFRGDLNRLEVTPNDAG